MIALDTPISGWLGYTPTLFQVHWSHIRVLSILEVWESQVKHGFYIDSFPCKMLLIPSSPPLVCTHFMAINLYVYSASPRRDFHHANLHPQQTFGKTPNAKNDDPLLLPPDPVITPPPPPPPKFSSHPLSTSTFPTRTLTSQLLTRQNLYTKRQVIGQLLSRH